MTVTVAPESEILYDSGRVPLWLRVPCLLLGLLCLVLLTDLIALGVSARTVFVPTPRLPQGWFPAFAGIAVLAAFMLQVWVGRKRILWAGEGHRLWLEDRWLLGTCRRSFTPVNLMAVQIRLGCLKASTFWDVSLLDSSGKTTWLTRHHSEEEGQAVAGRIADAIGRPLKSV